MALPLKVENNFVVGANDPSFQDEQNKELRHIWNLFRVEHSSAGQHAFLAKVGVGTYTSTTSHDTTVLNPLWLWIYSEYDPYIYFVSSSFPAGYAKRHDGFFRDYGVSLTATGFSLTSQSILNIAGVDYYYVAWGVGAMTDPQGTNNDPPTWIEHGEDILAGTGQPACRVEEDLYAKFSVGHSGTTGAHNLALWELVQYETGTFIADGSDAQTILLDMSGTPSLLWFMPRSPQAVSFFLQDFGNLRILSANGICTETGFVSVAAGSFTVDATKKENEKYILDVQGVGADGYIISGGTDVIDNSEHHWPFQVGAWASQSPKYSATQHSSNATSFYFPYQSSLTWYLATPGLSITQGMYGNVFASRALCTLNGDWSIKTNVFMNLEFRVRFLSFEFYGQNDVYGKLTFYANPSGAVCVEEYEYRTSTNGAVYPIIQGTTNCCDEAWHSIELVSMNDTLHLLIDGLEEGSPYRGWHNDLEGLSNQILQINTVEMGAPVYGISLAPNVTKTYEQCITDFWMYMDYVEIRATNKYFLVNDTINYVALSFPA